MKANQTSILMYGHDEHLLVTRQWVLQSRGYRVLTRLDLAGFANIAVDPPIRLLLLCHTLSAGDCTEAIAAASERWPEVRSVVLEGGVGRTPSGLLGQLLHTMDGPARLVAVVSEMLGSDARSSVPTRP
jgi:hypothetical protein